MRRTAAALVPVLALGFLTAPLVATGQPAGKVHRIGPLPSGTREQAQPFYRVFEERLRELGWIDGRNVVFEYRHAEGNVQRFPDLAAEIVRLKVDVIVSATTMGIAAARGATGTIPIVMVAGVDPIGFGFVASLARPGGNVTGLTFDVGPEQLGKRLELLKEVVPGVTRVAVLRNPALPTAALYWDALREAAGRLGVTLQSVEVRGPEETEAAFATMVRGRAGALFVITDPAWMIAHAGRLTALAARHRLPASYQTRELVEVGGLMSYGVNLHDLFRRAAGYVDRILRGAKPTDLPVEQPRKFELVLNPRAAKALGLTIPPSVLVQADELIQ